MSLRRGWTKDACGRVFDCNLRCAVARQYLFVRFRKRSRESDFDSAGNAVNEAPPATPVEIQGLSGLPKVGAEIIVVNDERKAREISQMRQSTQRLSRLAVRAPSLATAMLEEETEKKEANLIIKADVGGSREVLEGGRRHFRKKHQCKSHPQRGRRS